MVSDEFLLARKGSIKPEVPASQRHCAVALHSLVFLAARPWAMREFNLSKHNSRNPMGLYKQALR